MYKQIKDIENDPSPNTKSVLIETAEGFAVHFRCVKVEGQINNLELLYVPNPLFEAFQPIATELACLKSKKVIFTIIGLWFFIQLCNKFLILLKVR